MLALGIVVNTAKHQKGLFSLRVNKTDVETRAPPLVGERREVDYCQEPQPAIYDALHQELP